MTAILDQIKHANLELQAPISNQDHGSGQEDTQRLEQELRTRVRGEVRFTAGDRALYATDASNYREVPIGVVIPKDKADVIATMAVCKRHGVPVLGRGAGTSLAGQCCNAAVVIDMSKYMNRVLWIDPERKLARVEPGVVLDDLQQQARKHNLRFGPDPATHNHCTLGGMIGNNSCGIHSVMAQFYGPGARTSDNVESLEILTYDGAHFDVGPTSAEELDEIIKTGGRKGEIYQKLRKLGRDNAALITARYPDIPRRVSGYENLDQLLPNADFNVAQALVGTESTCVLVLEATVRLIEEPQARTLLVLGYPDVFAAGDHIPTILEHKPIGLEGLDHLLIGYQRKKGMHSEALDLLPEGKGYLFVEFRGNTKDESDEAARKLMEDLKQHDNPPQMKLFDNRSAETELWEVRESGLGATARIPDQPDTWPGWEDSAVHPQDIGKYLRDLKELFHKFGYNAAVYGHFGQGLVHCRIDFDLRTADGLSTFRAFLDAAAELIVRYNGTLSGEHGDGQARGELLTKMYGEEMMSVFREFKAIWDPDWKMNPGKVIDANPILANLRLGDNYNPWEPETQFRYPDDEYSFSRATLRCVGVGKCRRKEGGTMCPSYMVTHEEEHSTRGRARLLFEMLQGEAITDGWHSEKVKEALDLCLACKGCKNDCPVNVDMATYKAEFLSHYYQGKLRPVTGYTMGMIHWWARLASIMPGVVNTVTHMPIVSGVIKRLGGIAPEREIPKFAPQTFQTWFGQRSPQRATKSPVLLWPDTFNNYMHPEVATAAVEVLEAAGFQVIVPEQSLCCGRPLYDYGFLDQAKDLLQKTLAALRPEIRAGMPLVGLEPSCLAVFRDELTNLFPQDEDAQRLRQQAYTLAEFLEKHAPNFELPKLQRKAVVHGHCHHKSVMGFEGEQKLLHKVGLEFGDLDSGCCGMAGAFGFEADKYDVSVACGERVLLPEVRKADQETLIVADGFSCRQQIKQTTDREALHLAQVLQMALRQGPSGPENMRPEQADYLHFKVENAGARAIVRNAFGVVATALAGGALLWAVRQLVGRKGK